MSPRRCLAVAALVAAATAAGCSGQEPPVTPGTPTRDLVALCQDVATAADPPVLTYDVAQGLAGQALTICRMTLSPASPQPPAVTDVPARLTARPGWAEAVSTDRPRPAGCVDAVSTQVFVLHDGQFLLARNCGDSRQAGASRAP